MYIYIYIFNQSAIITLLQTKTNSKKLKTFIKKQLTKHCITLLPFAMDFVRDYKKYRYFNLFQILFQ